MTPRARLVATALGTVAGAAAAVAGTRMTLKVFTLVYPTVNVERLPVRFPNRVRNVSVADASGATTGVAMLLLLAALLVFLVGPRLRVGLFWVVVAGSIWLGMMVATADAEAALPEEARTDGPGAAVAIAGALAAATSALLALPAAGKVARLGLPEGASEDATAGSG